MGFQSTLRLNTTSKHRNSWQKLWRLSTFKLSCLRTVFNTFKSIHFKGGPVVEHATPGWGEETHQNMRLVVLWSQSTKPKIAPKVPPKNPSKNAKFSLKSRLLTKPWTPMPPQTAEWSTISTRNRPPRVSFCFAAIDGWKFPFFIADFSKCHMDIFNLRCPKIRWTRDICIGKTTKRNDHYLDFHGDHGDDHKNTSKNITENINGDESEGRKLHVKGKTNPKITL